MLAYSMNSGPCNGGCPGALESAFTLCLMVLLSSPGLAKLLSTVRHCISPLFLVFALLVSQVCQEQLQVRKTANRGGVRPRVL